MAELTAYLKSRKQNKYGATNQTAILSTEYYKQLAGVDAVHVAYRTAPEALPDVEDGTLDFMIMDGTFAVGPIKAGKIRALAVTTAQRIATLPDVPTMMEAGVGNFEFTPWWGAFVPAGTPQPIVAKLGAWMNQIARTDEARQFLERIAALPLSDELEGDRRAPAGRHREMGAAGEGGQDRAAMSLRPRRRGHAPAGRPLRRKQTAPIVGETLDWSRGER